MSGGFRILEDHNASHQWVAGKMQICVSADVTGIVLTCGCLAYRHFEPRTLWQQDILAPVLENTLTLVPNVWIVWTLDTLRHFSTSAWTLRHYSRMLLRQCASAPALVAEWVMPLAAVQAGQGSFPVRVEA